RASSRCSRRDRRRRTGRTEDEAGAAVPEPCAAGRRARRAGGGAAAAGPLTEAPAQAAPELGWDGEPDPIGITAYQSAAFGLEAFRAHLTGAAAAGVRRPECDGRPPPRRAGRGWEHSHS